MTDDTRRAAALRTAGLLFILAAAATIAAVVGRVSAGADQASLAASLAAIAESRWLYGIGGAARFLSGIALSAGTWCLRGAPQEQRPGSPAVVFLLAASGLLTACSGAAAVGLAAGAPEGFDAAGPEMLARQLETTASLRRVAGAAGFALAGLAIVAAARRQWRGGGALRRVAPAAALLGLAMQLVWLDAATWAHPLTGTAFVIWLAAAGSCLLKGRSWWG